MCNVIAINHVPALACRATSPQTTAGMQQCRKTKGRRGHTQTDFRSHVVAAAAHSSNSGRALQAQRGFLPFTLVVRRERDITLMLFTGDFAHTHTKKNNYGEFLGGGIAGEEEKRGSNLEAGGGGFKSSANGRQIFDKAFQAICFGLRLGDRQSRVWRREMRGVEAAEDGEGAAGNRQNAILT